MEESSSYPSAKEQAKNLTNITGKILKQVLQGDKIIAPDAIQKARIQVCHSCDKYDKYQKRCYECGCYVDVKARFALEGCPLGKWLDADSDWFEENYMDAVKDIINYDEEDIPTPPDNPNNGDVYIHRGKKWKFYGEFWEFVVD
jgi:hypothetical protein